MTAQLGELRITGIEWTGQRALSVEVETTRADLYLQLYAGRRLAGVSERSGSGRVTGQVLSKSPIPLTIVLVPAAERETDYGQRLPRRPWNQYRVNWSATGFPADTKWFDVAQSAEGESVDFATAQSRVPFYEGLEAYSFELEPFDESGTYEVGIRPRDDALPDGNPGTAATLTIPASVYPPDVQLNEDGTRLSVNVSDGNLEASFQYDW